MENRTQNQSIDTEVQFLYTIFCRTSSFAKLPISKFIAELPIFRVCIFEKERVNGQMSE